MKLLFIDALHRNNIGPYYSLEHSASGAPWRSQGRADPAITPLLVHTPPLECEGALDLPHIAFHTPTLISKYRDNSILRYEKLENSGVAAVFMLIRGGAGILRGLRITDLKADPAPLIVVSYP